MRNKNYFKRIVLILCLISVFSNSFAQSSELCDKIVAITYDAVDKKSSKELVPFLSENFQISGYSGPLALAILDQLLLQLNDSVVDYSITNKTLENGRLKLVYETHFANLGIKQTTFIFDSESKLDELALVEMKVKTLDSKGTNWSTPSNDFVKIPFELVGNLIMVKANVNGESQNFLFDSGAPFLIMNDKYLANDGGDGANQVSSQGVGGNVSMDIRQVEEFDFYGIKFNDQSVLTMDISHLEEAIGTKIYGLIGYDVFKNYDLFLDYQKKYIALVNPAKEQDFLNNTIKATVAKEIGLKINNHLAITEIDIDGKIYQMALDCGAESNLMDAIYYNDLKENLSKSDSTELEGANKESVDILVAKLKLLTISGLKFKRTVFSFSDISHLNAANEGVKLDGIIGYEILSKQKTYISYQNKKLLFLK